MEDFEIFDTFTDTGEFDRHTGDSLNGENAAAFRVAVEFGDDKTGNIELFMEGLGDIDDILTGKRVDRQQYFAGLCDFLDIAQFLHQFLIDLQTARGIDDDDIEAFILRVFKTLTDSLNSVDICTEAEDIHIDLRAKCL